VAILATTRSKLGLKEGKVSCNYICRYWYSSVYSNAYLINVVVIVFILCSVPVYSMSSFVFCFGKLTYWLCYLVWYVSFVPVMCICLCMLFFVPYCKCCHWVDNPFAVQ
jgi:hypothetical protein